MVLAVFDIGGSAVKYGKWEEKKLHSQGSFKTPDTFLEMVAEMKKVSAKFGTLDGVAISSPGAVNVAKRRIDGISAVEYLHQRPIFDQLEAAFGVPVTIENDANCAGISEIELGAGTKAQNAVFVVIGTGIGGSIFINRKIYKGSHLFGGEFGLMKPFGKSILSPIGTAVNKARTYSEATGQKVDGRTLFELADSGDEVAQKYLAEMYDALAHSLYDMQVSIDPEIIIIGGGISVRPDVIENIKRRIFDLLKAEGVESIMPEVVACKFKNDANLIGAAANFEVLQG
ncbi:N-acetylmannosamine kinase [Enterococcus saigonensis]|uniref:N-acetylmannosamine kinase n=1 Tax=Enterococcus saigonensis TaxID=1805431 RepID=A0A679I9E5_9ENTE|nr:ROK family protein [Enterococcus saigonensis]BCA84649.1 N-acetylmannosamine kinase [Enterococcus saigonensis]